MKKNFIECGFEFTTSKKEDTILDPKIFHVSEEEELAFKIARPLTEAQKKAKEKKEKARLKKACIEESRYMEKRILEEFGIKIKLPPQIPYEERESTKRYRLERELENKRLRKEELNYISNSIANPVIPHTNKDKYISIDNRKKLSKFRWIRNRAQGDSCGLEISTPIVTKQNDVERYYKEFISFVRSHNLTVSPKDAICGLGGCHIHMSLSDFGEIEKHYFIKNIAIFFTNCPELNWGFNDPNDNKNANSLLMPVKHMGENFHIGNMRIGTRWGNGKEKEGVTKIRRGSRLFKFRKDNNIFRMMMSAPLEISLYKKYSFLYNKEYNTIEFRIFDMPDTFKRHMLHYDVAVAIYRLCEDYARRHETLELTYTEFDYDLARSIERFYKCMDLLKIRRSRTGQMIENIKTRYKWTSEQTDKNYLL